ncbi:unnamed protein product, partial [Discosporangium mesarthrocarpum]
MTGEPAPELLCRIKEDPIFRDFTDRGFDPAAFASKVVASDVSSKVGSAAMPLNPVLGPANNDAGSKEATGIGVGVVGGDRLGGGGGLGGLGSLGPSSHEIGSSAESVSSQAEITLESMSTHISRIDAAIRSHILDNEESFLGGVGSVSDLARRTEAFHMGVRNLRRSLSRIKREV